MGTVRRNTDLHQLSGTRRASWRMLETLEQINYLNYFYFFFLSHNFCASLRFLWACCDFECCVGNNW